jgi:hypothetical protein
MTERLGALMRAEVDSLIVPPAAPERILAQGRGVRRRRRFTHGAAGLALAGLLGTGIGFVVSSSDTDSPGVVDAAGPTTALRGATFTVGVTVYLDGGAVTATIDDDAVKSSYYTSAGLLVRHGDNNASDGGGPQRFSLVTPEGVVTPVSVVTEETVPGVDADQPYLAYAVVEGGVVQVVVHDVVTDELVARVPVPDATEWGGWSAPPVALDGDTVFVGTDDTARAVDWRTGEVTATDMIRPGYPVVNGGRTVVPVGPKGSKVVDVATGETLMAEDTAHFRLSPDGRFAALPHRDGKSFEVHEIGTNISVTFRGSVYAYSWTPEGDLVRLLERHVETCSFSTTDCTTAERTIPIDGGGTARDDVRFAGQTYES